MMKKIRLFGSSTAVAAAVSVLLLASCSSDENLASEAGKIEVSGEHFTFTTEDFGAEESLTRASAPTAAKPQTIDLGDGLEAEVTILRDAKAPATRATAPISDGHYTIYAIDNATNTRVTGANSKVSGTVSGGHFTKDPGTKLELAPGTYTFVCFNDAVTDNGTSLTVANGADALIGTKTETITDPGWQVNFTMKHQTARVRFNIVSYTNEGTGVTANLASAGSYTTAQNYPVDASSATATTTAAIAASQTFPTSGTVVNSPYTKVYNNATDWNYFLPGVAVNDLTLNFTAGTIYGKALAGKSIALTNATSTLAQAGSYTINVKLKTVLYLFEDGTVGALGDKGSRTPIGLVSREKTTTQEGTAMALYKYDYYDYQSLVPSGTAVATNWRNMATTGGDGVQWNTTVYWGLSDGQYDMDGYNHTWNAANTVDGTVKAEDQNRFPGFYLAGHYTPSVAVTGANVGKWYIPAVGEWLEMFNRFASTPITIPASTAWREYANFDTAGYNKLIAAMQAVNPGMDFGFIWTSTTQDASRSGIFDAYDPIFISPSSIDIWFPAFHPGDSWGRGSNVSIIPFVHF